MDLNIKLRKILNRVNETLKLLTWIIESEPEMTESLKAHNNNLWFSSKQSNMNINSSGTSLLWKHVSG
jgi:hypothetical protein